MVASDLSEIPAEVIRIALIETVENQFKSKNYKINVSSASTAGESNFVGIVYRVSFSDEDEGKNGKNLASKLILKVAPQNPARRAQFFSHACFMREIYMYDEVRVKFSKVLTKNCEMFENNPNLCVQGSAIFQKFRAIKGDHQ